uniref:F-ATPase gamma subunit n=1 Tax=Crocodylus porosus TaxID=8502 RepID=A0A7M4DXY0_CROPO
MKPGRIRMLICIFLGNQTRPGRAHLVATLLLAHLAVPAQLLKPLGLDAVGDGLRAEEIRLAHGAAGCPAPSRLRRKRKAVAPEAPPRAPGSTSSHAQRLRGAGTLTFSRVAAAAPRSSVAMFARGAAVLLYRPQWLDTHGWDGFIRDEPARKVPSSPTFLTVSNSRISAISRWGQVRNMATLKDITRRLKSIRNIQKITKSMKMVAAAKYARAERELKPARVYGVGALALYEKAEIKASEDKKKHLIVGVSSDRGLCGAIHTSVAKTIKSEITALSDKGKEVMVVGVGDKLRGLLQRTHSQHFLVTFKEVGRKPPSFGDASVIALELLNSGYEFDEGSIIYNRFRSVISYRTDEKPFFSLDTVAGSENISIYDDIDADVLRNYQEYALANILFYSLKESTTSEQSARMTAMDNASKNACVGNETRIKYLSQGQIGSWWLRNRIWLR